MCVCARPSFLLLRGHPPIMPRFSGVPQGLRPFGVHHHVVHTCAPASCALLARAGLLAAAFCCAPFLVVVKIYIDLSIEPLQMMLPVTKQTSIKHEERVDLAPSSG